MQKRVYAATVRIALRMDCAEGKKTIQECGRFSHGYAGAEWRHI